MNEAQFPGRTRRFGRADAMRAVISLVLVAVFAGLYWIALPSLQARFLPDVPGGEDGPWIVRPILAMRFGAMAVMTAVTLPFAMRPLHRLWKQEDASRGTRLKPLRPWTRLAVFIKGFLLLAIYGMALAFYLLSWLVISPEGIEQRLPWTTLRHSFDDIATLQTIPEGERSERLDENGPWYSIQLKSGRVITVGLSNEGVTLEELQAMTDLVSEKAGQEWQRRADSKPR